jgi:hypothetical protein
MDNHAGKQGDIAGGYRQQKMKFAVTGSVDGRG